MIKNPLLPLKEFESAPHFHKISKNTINSMRILASQLIASGVKMLKMSNACYCTAQLLFQQFFALESFLDHSLIEVVMAAVFVAGKVEECIRRARDIVNVFHHLYCLIRGLPAHSIDYVGDTYYIWRDRLCNAEALLLRSLGFHVQPASPVPLLISYLKVMELPQLKPELPQVAFCWLNDLLRTPAGVLFQPNVLAVAAIDLAASRLNFSFPTDLIAEWYALFDVNGEELKECQRIVLEALQGAGEIDFLLPLTREELSIFASQIESESEEDMNTGERERRDYEKSTSRDYDGSHSRERSYSRDRAMSRSRSNSRDSHHSSRSSHHESYSSHHGRDYRSRSRSRIRPAAPYHNKQHRN